ncbi:MAG: hypothetical protein ACRC8S_09675 [Fimbriiglobus sp.]
MFRIPVLTAVLVASLLASFEAQGAHRFAFPRPISKEIPNADVICFGWLANAKAPKNDDDPGSVELYIARYYKGEKLLKDPRLLVIPSYYYVPKGGIRSGVFFIKMEKGTPDVFDSRFGGPSAARYVEGLMECPKGDVFARLEYCFDHLEGDNGSFAWDEFPKAEAKQYLEAARKSNPERVKQLEAELAEEK